MFGRVEIMYAHQDDALTVPRSALIEEDGETAVFVVENAPAKAPANDKKTGADKVADKKVETAAANATPAAAGLVAHRKLVKSGYVDGDKVEIRSGLEVGTRVITIGRNAVRDGTPVQVLENKVIAQKAAGDKA
jgi:membrane fusion protein (multidrug efflux system)